MNAEDAQRVSLEFELTIRQIPIYMVGTYLNAKWNTSDNDILEFQTQARDAAGSRFTVGRLKRKIRWRSPGSEMARVCWYWDLDG